MFIFVVQRWRIPCCSEDCFKIELKQWLPIVLQGTVSYEEEYWKLSNWKFSISFEISHFKLGQYKCFTHYEDN